MLPSIIFPLALFVSYSVAAAPPRHREPLHIPVLRRQNARRSGTADLDRIAASAQATKDKFRLTSSSLSRRAQTTDIGITNQGQDTSYFAQVSVGTPPQNFDLVLDTGSSDLWFATASCVSCSQGTPLLQPTRSTTIQASSQRISLSYGSGNATGIVMQDTVSMGPFTVNPQVFIAVDQVSDGLIDGQLSGIMGLAFQGIANSGALPFWQALLNQNQLTNPEFSFFITRFLNDPTAQSEEPGGVLTLGGTNSTFFQGNIDFQPSTSTGGFWLQSVAGVSVDGKTVSIGNAVTAAIDTGTTLIGAPTAAVNGIWSAVKGAVPLSGQMAGFWSFPCSTQVTVSISFGGPSWPISIDDLNLGTVGAGNSQCLGAIFDIELGTGPGQAAGTPEWIVGDTFLKNVYSVFRAQPPSVGFAQLSAAAGGSSGTPGPVGTAKLTGSLPTPTGGSNSAQRQLVPFGNTGIVVASALSLLTTVFVLAA